MIVWEDNSLPIIALRTTRGNPEVVFTNIQTWMFHHIQYFEFFWWAVWIVTLIIVLCVLWQTAVRK